MSAGLSTAIYQRLVGIETMPVNSAAASAQALLAQTLAPDPDTNHRPAVFRGSWETAKNAAGQVPMPCITYRIAGGQNDGRFASGMAVGATVVEMEIWGAGRLGSTLLDVAESLSILLDRCRASAPALPCGTDGLCYWMEPTMLLQEIPDANHNAHAGLIRWSAIESRVST